MLLAMRKPVSKLVDLDIDEVSVVDRGANQHSLIAFSKSLAYGVPDAEDGMSATFTDENGFEVAEEDLQVGDVVVDDDGNEYEIVDADDIDDDEVGKSMKTRVANHAFYRGQDAMGRAKMVGGRLRNRYTRAGTKTVTGPYGAQGSIPSGRVANWRNIGTDAGIAGGVGAAGGGAAYALTRDKDTYGKSLGEEILGEFSKAVNDRDRELVIAKMADEVDRANALADEALGWAAAEHDARMTEAFISKAAEYNLPVDAEVLGPILKSMAETLSEEELDVLDALFYAIGDALYDEVGYVGESSNSSVLDHVNAFADEFVAKADVSHAQAMTAMFETNPAAYDAYIAEMGR